MNSNPEDKIILNAAEAPLMALLFKDPTTMDDVELKNALSQLRQAKSSKQTQKAAVKKAPQSKKDFKYLLK
jgi:hypothetical protein